MSKLCLVIVLMLIAGRNRAQNYPAPGNQPLNYFILIQAEDGQAFYVRLNDKLYSSSPAGHLILSQLQDSIYIITVGFQGQRSTEQRYLLNIHEKDWFLRLISHDNRWGLFDDREQPLVPVDDPAPERPLLAGTKKDDAFSQLMSAIVQDTAVMYNTYSAAPPDSAPQPVPASTAAMTLTQSNPAPRTTATQMVIPQITTPQTAAPQTAVPQPVPLQPSASIVSDSTGLPGTNPKPGSPPDTTSLHFGAPSFLTSSPTRVAVTDSLSPAGISISSGSSIPSGSSVASGSDASVPSAPTGVVKLSERKSSQSLNLIFADHPADKKADTIDVVIPVDSPVVSRDRSQYPDSAHSSRPHHSQSADTSHSTAVHHPQPPDTPHSSPSSGHAPKPDTSTMVSTPSHKSALPLVNSDCHAFATDYDVDKLRIRMLDEKKDDDRILAAYKVFKIKCFTSRQIRALSEVFTTDGAKFKFLATAYPFVSDDQFVDLANLLSDPVYTGKFRTMTDHH